MPINPKPPYIHSTGVYMVLFLFCCASCKQHSPHEKNDFDFGVVAGDSEVMHKFTIANASNSPLTITAMRSTCGCTAAHTDNEVIEPNSSSEVSVVFRSGQKKGAIRENVIVTLSNGEVRNLTLSGYVDQKNIKELDFGSLLRGKKKTLRFTLPSSKKETTVVSSIKVSHDYLEIAKVPSMIETYDVTVLDTIPYGEFHDDILLDTDDAVCPQKRIIVFGKVMYPVEVVPSEILLGQVSPGEHKAVSLAIHSPYGFTISETRIFADKQMDTASDSRTYLNTSSTNHECLLDLVIPDRLEGQNIYTESLVVEVRIKNSIEKMSVDVYGLYN